MSTDLTSEQSERGTAPTVGEPTHSEDGADLTPIRWMLDPTPAERLQILQSTVRSIHRLRGEETED